MFKRVQQYFSKFLQCVLLLVLAVSLSACNTVAGIGKDIGAAGQTLENSAKKNKKY